MARYYVKDTPDAPVRGPMSGKELKGLAASGTLKKQSLISPDGKKWSLAGKVKGLTFGAPSPAVEADEVPPLRDAVPEPPSTPQPAAALPASNPSEDLQGMIVFAATILLAIGSAFLYAFWWVPRGGTAASLMQPMRPISRRSEPAQKKVDPEEEAARKAAEAAAKALERKHLKAGRRFIDALVANEYEAAYAELAECAKVSVVPWQFGQLTFIPTWAREARKRKPPPVRDLTSQQFVEFMGKLEYVYGVPATLDAEELDSQDPKILRWKRGEGSEEDRLRVAVTVGVIPDHVPPGVRRACVTYTIGTKQTLDHVKRDVENSIVNMTGYTGKNRKAIREMYAKDLNTTEDKVVEKLAKQQFDNPNFHPRFRMRLVLVEEGEALKVGHFQLVMPSLWD
jgi:hypothetical protein